MEKLISDVFGGEELEEKPINPYFEDFGYSSSKFSINSGAYFVYFMLLVAVFPILFILHRTCAKFPKCKHPTNLMKTIMSLYKYTIFLRGIMEIYIFVALFAMMNLARMSFENAPEAVTSILSVMYLGILTFMILWTLFFFCKKKD